MNKLFHKQNLDLPEWNMIFDEPAGDEKHEPSLWKLIRLTNFRLFFNHEASLRRYQEKLPIKIVTKLVSMCCQTEEIGVVNRRFCIEITGNKNLLIVHYDAPCGADGRHIHRALYSCSRPASVSFCRLMLQPMQMWANGMHAPCSHALTGMSLRA